MGRAWSAVAACLVAFCLALGPVQGPAGAAGAGTAGPGTTGTGTTTFTSTALGATTGTTHSFQMTAAWTMAWRYDCSALGTAGTFYVTVHQPTGDLATDAGPDELGISGSGTDSYFDTGTFHLTVYSTCKWSITVAMTRAAPLAPPATFASGQIGSSGSTPQVKLTAPWTLTWTYDCSGFPASPVFIVDVIEPVADTHHDAGPNEQATRGSGTESYTDSGVFSLAVYSTCKWSITLDGAGAAPLSSGYDLVGADGGVFAFPPPGTSSGYFGSLPQMGIVPNKPVVGMVATTNDRGYFLVAADGGVFAFGDAPYLGSLPAIGVVPRQPITGIVATGTDLGYLLVGRDGGVFAFGDARYLGSLPGEGVSVDDIVGIAATPSGDGYWLVGADGTVYAFGKAQRLGSALGAPSPISAVAATATGGGYWVVTSDGAVEPFGDAGFFGDLPASHVTPGLPVIGIVPTTGTGGYWLFGADGGMFTFGDADFIGSLPGIGVHVTDVVGAVSTA